MTVLNDLKINGISLPLQPSEHRWVDKDQIGTDGNGRAIYAVYREYELKWDFLSPDEFSTMNGYFLSIGQTGTANVDLPKYPPSSTYQFQTYSGTILRELTYSNYFENYYQGVKMMIARIRTS
jgi:hypothetical protein